MAYPVALLFHCVGIKINCQAVVLGSNRNINKLTLSYSVIQIFNEVFHIFDTYTDTYQRIS